MNRAAQFIKTNKKFIGLSVFLMVFALFQGGYLFADGPGASSGLGLESFNADQILGEALNPLQKFAKWTLSIFFNTAVVALVFLFFFIKGLRIISRDSAMWLKGAVHIVVAVVYGAGPFVINMLSKATPL
jgi:ABC-type amino acid transport system permease subunit